VFTEQQKDSLKQQLIACLQGEAEVRRIVIFGSFLESSEPQDLDVAVFQDSNEKYLPLALKYRKKIRSISRLIPVDIIPLRAGVAGATFLDEIGEGEVIYER
jgi:predicted nucleotidyltransferase